MFGHFFQNGRQNCQHFSILGFGWKLVSWVNRVSWAGIQKRKFSPTSGFSVNGRQNRQNFNFVRFLWNFICMDYMPPRLILGVREGTCVLRLRAQSYLDFSEQWLVRAVPEKPFERGLNKLDTKMDNHARMCYGKKIISRWPPFSKWPPSKI